MFCIKEATQTSFFYFLSCQIFDFAYFTTLTYDNFWMQLWNLTPSIFLFHHPSWHSYIYRYSFCDAKSLPQSSPDLKLQRKLHSKPIHKTLSPYFIDINTIFTHIINIKRIICSTNMFPFVSNVSVYVPAMFLSYCIFIAQCNKCNQWLLQDFIDCIYYNTYCNICNISSLQYIQTLYPLHILQWLHTLHLFRSFYVLQSLRSLHAIYKW